MRKKKYRYMFFCNSPAIGNEKKKRKKKNVGAEIRNGLLPIEHEAGRAGAGAGRARGAQAGSWASGRAGARQQARGRGARGDRGTGAGRAGWPGLCTWCTRPVFCPV